jgi:transcription-repair coupling factor (superfamily II helicase)
VTIGGSVLIPETYVSDLRLRLSLYHEAGDLKDLSSVQAFKEGLEDRFGPLPEEAENFLEVLNLKILCRACFVEKLEAGPKGMSFRFRKNECHNPWGLALFLNQQSGTATLKPDHRIVLTRAWDTLSRRVEGIKKDLNSLKEALSQSI